MQKTTYSILSTDNKTNLHAIRWQPDTAPCAVLQITHGMVEFIDRYDEFATFLTERGFVVAGHDQLGHGDSVATKDDWGYIADSSEPEKVLVEDIHKVRMQLQGEYPDLPYYMLGHSFGSYLMREYLCYHGENLNGAIIMGTGYVGAGMTAFGQLLIALIRLFKGDRYRSELIRQLSYSKSYKQYDLIGKDQGNCWLTKDREIVKAYYAEPRCTFLFTLNGYRALMRTVEYACYADNLRKMPKDLPVFLVSGAEDPVGDLSVGVRKVQEMLMSAGIAEVDCMLYPGDRHEILNETDRQQVYEDLFQWMSKRNTVNYKSKSGQRGFDHKKAGEAIEDAMENIYI